MHYGRAHGSRRAPYSGTIDGFERRAPASRPTRWHARCISFLAACCAASRSQPVLRWISALRHGDRKLGFPSSWSPPSMLVGSNGCCV